MLEKIGDAYIETTVIESIERVGKGVRIWTKSGRSTYIEEVSESDFETFVESAKRHGPISREDLASFRDGLANAIVQADRRASSASRSQP